MSILEPDWPALCQDTARHAGYPPPPSSEKSSKYIAERRRALEQIKLIGVELGPGSWEVCEFGDSAGPQILQGGMIEPHRVVVRTQLPGIY